MLRSCRPGRASAADPALVQPRGPPCDARRPVTGWPRATPARSLEYAERARQVTDVCRFEVVGGSHTLLTCGVDAWSVAADFVLGTLGCGPLPDAVVEGMTVADSLRTPLADGYGR